MRKALILSLAAAAVTMMANAAFDQAPVDVSGWSGKYITLKGNAGNNVNRYLFDTTTGGNQLLKGQTAYAGADRYWQVETEAEYGGMMLKNVITGRYVGTVHEADASWIAMLDDAENAGIYMVYEKNGYPYALTSTKVRRNGNKNTVNSGTLVNNPQVCHEAGATKGYGDWTNTVASDKVWLFCTTASADVVNVSAFGNPNGNSHWEISVMTEEEALADYAKCSLNSRFPAISDEVVSDFALQMVNSLPAEAATFAEKTADIKARVDALSSTYNFAPTATSGWVGKYIVISGTGEQAENNNTGRMMFDSDEVTNLSVKRNINGLSKYWIAEPDALYSGAYLKNAATGRYIGTVGKLNNTVIPMQAEKSQEAGVVMMYLRNGVQFVTTTKIRDGENLVDNPNINHADDIFRGFATFGAGANEDNKTKLWMYCTEGSKTDPAAYAVKNYGNGNANGHWAVSVMTEAEVLRQLAIECIKEQHEWLTDEAEINYWAGLVAPVAAALPEKTLAEKYEYVRAETASKRYLASELDGKQLIIGSMDAGDGLALRRIANVGGALSFPATVGREESVWTATYNETEDGVLLSNGSKYIARMPLSGNFSLTDNVDEAGYYRLYKIEGQYALTCTKKTDGSAVNPIGRFGAGNSEGGYWMQGKAEGVITRWGSNPPSSRWQFTELDDVVLPEAEVAPSVTLSLTENQHVVTISHAAGLTKHHALLYEPSHLITISAVASENGADAPAPQADEIEHSVAPGEINVAEDGTLTYAIGRQFAAGTYAVNVPAGLFRVGENQKSKEVKSQFTVKEDGTLAIVEIESKSASETIYDLSGRRLAAPVKGINIINGRKVLVK